jgi:type I restriction enzyme S subunit
VEVRPGYKQTEVGVIPEDWEVVPATEACELVVDCKNRTPPVVADSEFAVVRTPNVREGKFVLEDLRYTDEGSYREWTARAVPRVGDILITREAPPGEVCAVPEERKVCLGQRMMLYRPSPASTDSSYLLYALMSTPVRTNLLKKIGGSTVGHAKVDDIRCLQFARPSLHEQRAIAAALSDVDALLDGLDRLIAKKRDLKQAAMQQLLTGHTRLPGFHEEWEVRRLPSLATIPQGQVDPRVEPFRSMYLIGPEHVESGTGKLLIRRTALDQGAISGKYLFRKGDVVYGKINPYLRKAFLADFDGLCSADMYPLRPVNGVAPGFLLATILSRNFSTYSESVSVRSGMPKINREEIAAFSTEVPKALEEQSAIAVVLSDMDTELALLERRRDKTRAIKQGMMQELLTGRKRLV